MFAFLREIFEFCQGLVYGFFSVIAGFRQAIAFISNGVQLVQDTLDSSLFPAWILALATLILALGIIRFVIKIL